MNVRQQVVVSLLTNDLYRPSPVVGLGARTPLPLNLRKNVQPSFADLNWSSATGQYFTIEYTTDLGAALSADQATSLRPRRPTSSPSPPPTAAISIV